MKRSIVLPGVALVLAILIGRSPTPARAEGTPFELRNGDRVVLVGGTMIERDQESGYLETRLIRRFPDRSISFRNLGWSGDTVEGPSRAGFGSVDDGYKHLIEHVLALKPTVVLVGYGANEAFDGPAGLPKFLQGLEKFLKAIEPTKAYVVFLGPPRQEDFGPPLPDPARHNADLALYRDAIKAKAENRGAFVDLFGSLPDGAKSSPRLPLTENSLHFTPYGYYRAAAAIEQRLIGFNFRSILHRSGPITVKTNFQTTFGDVTPIAGGLRFSLLDEWLPASPSPGDGPEIPAEGRVLSVSALEPGRYVLKVDGQPVATAEAAAWKEGVAIRKGPEIDQVEALRSVINAKNQLYFYRWRPQNETYLFGFRKHEQGKNAREIVEFDPLIAAKETEIARLRVPVSHTYELIREGEVGR